MNEKTKRKPELPGIAKQEVSDRIKALSEEELVIVLRNIPSRLIWEEIFRRDQIKDEIISGSKKLLRMEE